MGSPCKAIIFDLGKVIFDISFDLVFDFWAERSGTNSIDLKNRFLFYVATDDFERGDISVEEFRAKVKHRLNMSLEDIQFDKGWNNLYLDVYPGIDELLQDLQKDYKVVALSNTNLIHKWDWAIRYKETLKYFEKVFSSHEIRSRKPEEKAFRTVLEYLDVKPTEAIFLDDNLENISGARSLGIETIHVTSPDLLRDELLFKLGL